MVLPVEYSPLNETAGDATVVHFTGSEASLDEETAPGVGDELLALAEEPGVSDLVLDFRNVAFVSSTALGTLVRLHNKLAAGGRHMALCGLRPCVREVFAVTGLGSCLDLRPAGEQTGSPPAGRRPGPPVGILVVDDEPAIRCLLDAQLRREGFHVWLAGHGYLAIELFERHGPEIAVVLLDVSMPGMDGPQTLARLRQLCPSVRCCFMSGNPAPYTEEDLRRMAAVRIFRKPFPFPEVLETLHTLAGRAHPGPRNRWVEIPPGKGV
jgi:anti-anti-sigma factor